MRSLRLATASTRKIGRQRRVRALRLIGGRAVPRGVVSAFCAWPARDEQQTPDARIARTASLGVLSMPTVALPGRSTMTPPHAPRRLVIATRESALAMWQARHVQTRLQALYPRASDRAARHDDAG